VQSPQLKVLETSELDFIQFMKGFRGSMLLSVAIALQEWQWQYMVVSGNVLLLQHMSHAMKMGMKSSKGFLA
jgi:hypothetical protein